MDYETAFLLAGHWRVLSPGRLTHMFGKDGIELSDNQPALRRSHPEMRDTENKLPKRNIIVPRASQDIDWMEGSIYD